MHDDPSEYLSASQRKARAEQRRRDLEQQGYTLDSTAPFTRKKIAQSFWGHAWCRHLEELSDYENRLPSGRSYLRNGCLLHLEIKSGEISAIVGGDEVHEFSIEIDPLPSENWDVLKNQCSGKIGSLIELLQGKLSDEVMKTVIAPDTGLFPSPQEIRHSCCCPDWADLCTHSAAALYGVGLKLDQNPELLFLLRGVDHTQLIDTNAAFDPNRSKRRRISTASISDVFGIEMDDDPIANQALPSATPAISKPQPTPQKTPVSTKKAPKEQAPKPAPQSGNDIRKLRRRFGMSEYDFGLILDVSATVVTQWESQKKTPHQASQDATGKLHDLAQLTIEQAQQRLMEYR